MPKLNLPRDVIAQIVQGNRQAIPAFEKVFSMLSDGGLPTSIEEANTLAGNALTLAQAAMASMVAMADALSALEVAPAPAPVVDADDFRPASAPLAEIDDFTPRAHLGTIAAQNADNVEVTGGTAAGIAITGSTVDSTPIGATTASSGKFTTVSASGQVTSTVATGTAPLVVASTTKVTNLYVDRAALADNATTATTATTAGSLGTPGTYPADATDLPTAITLVNFIKSRNISRGV